MNMYDSPLGFECSMVSFHTDEDRVHKSYSEIQLESTWAARHLLTMAPIANWKDFSSCFLLPNNLPSRRN